MITKKLYYFFFITFLVLTGCVERNSFRKDVETVIETFSTYGELEKDYDEKGRIDYKFTMSSLRKVDFVWFMFFDRGSYDREDMLTYFGLTEETIQNGTVYMHRENIPDYKDMYTKSPGEFAVILAIQISNQLLLAVECGYDKDFDEIGVKERNELFENDLEIILGVLNDSYFKLQSKCAP